MNRIGGDSPFTSALNEVVLNRHHNPRLPAGSFVFSGRAHSGNRDFSRMRSSLRTHGMGANASRTGGMGTRFQSHYVCRPADPWPRTPTVRARALVGGPPQRTVRLLQVMPRPLGFALSALAVLMASIDGTITVVALPQLSESLNTSLSWVGWTLTSYSLVQIIMYPLA